MGAEHEGLIVGAAGPVGDEVAGGVGAGGAALLGDGVARGRQLPLDVGQGLGVAATAGAPVAAVAGGDGAQPGQVGLYGGDVDVRRVGAGVVPPTFST